MPTGGESQYEAASSNIVAIVGLNAALKAVDIEKSRTQEQELTDI